MSIANSHELRSSDDELASLLTRITTQDAELAMRNHEAILKMTEEVFPGVAIRIDEVPDPEIENFEHLAVVVVIRGDVEQLLAGNREWHQRLRGVAPEAARHYVLSLSAA